MKKKRIVENDKSKILATIEDLDQKKNQALNIAWQKVSESKIVSFILSEAKMKNIGNRLYSKVQLEMLVCV